ncbi:MAG: hypothetical protein LBK23_11210 [Oscillospiraceae bacterium]|jgi:D-alanyl-D-alanine carboxypeptidase (penicillin-binding protein 5/6)|nr:hypothetical protein [Oscillospiraceae bacterium]
MKKLKSAVLLSLAAAFIAGSVQIRARAAEPSPPPDFLAESAFLAEADSGDALFEKNAGVRRGPDALVKLMTILLAAEAVERGDISRSELVTASDGAVSGIKSGGGASVSAGEAAPFIDWLYLAYTGGSDAACNVIAERVSGTVPEFIASMNARAAQLGCSDTSFTNAHGALDDAQYSTARDISIIARQASKSALFTEIASAPSYTTSETNVSPPRKLASANYTQVETRQRYYYKYVVFGRASSTYENGYACVEFAEREEFSCVAVVLGARAVILEDESTELQNLTEARRLFEWGYENYSRRAVLSSHELVARAEIAFGDGADFVNLRPDRDVSLILPVGLGEDEIVRETKIYSEEAGGPLSAPVSAGDELGEITVSRGGKLLASAKLVADSSVALLRAKYMKSLVTEAARGRWAKIIIAAAAIVFFAYAVIVVRYNIIRARRVKRANAAKQRIIDERRGRGK